MWRSKEAQEQSILHRREDATSGHDLWPKAVQMLIEAFSQSGSGVLDPFCNTGTTQRVALGFGRKASGYEVTAKIRSCWEPLKYQGLTP
jgi:hypothetical protein